MARSLSLTGTQKQGFGDSAGTQKTLSIWSSVIQGRVGHSVLSVLASFPTVHLEAGLRTTVTSPDVTSGSDVLVSGQEVAALLGRRDGPAPPVVPASARSLCPTALEWGAA